MERSTQQRSKSLKRPNTQQIELNLDQILKNINPLNKKTIELEDMKRVLLKLPEGSRAIVQKIFHSHIFNSKCFVLDVSEFCRLFGQLGTNREMNYEGGGGGQYKKKRAQNLTYAARSGGRENKINKEEFTSKNTSQFIDNKSELASVKNTSPNCSFFKTPRSNSPNGKPKNFTYTQLYQEKKLAPARKKTEKLQVHYTETKETADYSPLPKSVEAFNTNQPFKDTYSNVQELLDIRRAYFLQALKK